jgi:VIT1/CCC1 family predicted Fe2+/Mn2+ transporter
MLPKVHLLLRVLAASHLVAGVVAFWLFVAAPHLSDRNPPVSFIAFIGAFGIALVAIMGDFLLPD